MRTLRFKGLSLGDDGETLSPDNIISDPGFTHLWNQMHFISGFPCYLGQTFPLILNLVSFGFLSLATNRLLISKLIMSQALF